MGDPTTGAGAAAEGPSSEIARLQQKLKDAENKNRDLDEELKKAEGEMAELTAKRDELTGELEKTKAAKCTAEIEKKDLAERLKRIEAAEDPLPEDFDEPEAAKLLDRVLGITPPPMTPGVEDLLWTHALRRLGVLTGTEYELRKKRILARDIEPSAPGDRPAVAGALTPTQPVQPKPEEKQ